MGVKIGNDVEIHPTAKINVKEGFIGDRSVIRAYAEINGRYVNIGSEAMICEYAIIGGGNCYEADSSLIAGDFLHVGRGAFLNQGYGLKIGNEVGLGVGTKLYTHGGYLSEWRGFPAKRGRITIGDNVWIPNAQVNPKVDIGRNTVIMPMSLVNDDIPPGSLAGGVPCRILREKEYPVQLTEVQKDKIWTETFGEAVRIYYQKSKAEELPKFQREDLEVFRIDDMLGHVTIFDIKRKAIRGDGAMFSEILKNQLRRRGVRFRYYMKDGKYVNW